jgi:hypothetical protein
MEFVRRYPDRAVWPPATPDRSPRHKPCRLRVRDQPAMRAVNDTQELGFLSKLVIALTLLLIAAGVFWYGVTFDTLRRLWHNLIERPDALMRFRFALQPLMAAAFAIRDGLRDARAGRAPFFTTILSRPGERADRLREAVNATARIILLGLLMDMIYQILVLRTFYPNEAVIIALLLGFVPYVVVRGLATRAAIRRYRATPR